MAPPWDPGKSVRAGRSWSSGRGGTLQGAGLQALGHLGVNDQPVEAQSGQDVLLLGGGGGDVVDPGQLPGGLVAVEVAFLRMCTDILYLYEAGSPIISMGSKRCDHGGMDSTAARLREIPWTRAPSSWSTRGR